MPIIDNKKLLGFYNRNRFLDIYKVTRQLWAEPEAIETFSVETIVTLGRIANRLGGGELQKKLSWTAIEKDPENPYVKYYARRAVDGFNLLNELVEYDKNPEPCFEDPESRAAWFGSYAWIFSFCRDFDQAEKLLERAKVEKSDLAWVYTCEAEVLFKQDRWRESAHAARMAWEISPGTPATASVLGRSLVKQNKINETLNLFLGVLKTCQSYETMMDIIWYLCVKAERTDEKNSSRYRQKAYSLSKSLSRLAPLADKDTKSRLAAVQADIAILQGSTDRIKQHLESVDLPFYKTLLDNIKKKSEGRRTVLPFRPVYQKHLTCFPSSIASVLGRFNIKVNEDELASELTYNGTATWRVIDWLKSQGFCIRLFPVTPSNCRSVIKTGLPFIYCVEYENSSHAMAAVGLDTRMDTLVVHDPSAERLGNVLVSRIHEYEAPFGPEGMAIVPENKKELLKIIPAKLSWPMEAFHDYFRQCELHGIRQGQKVIEKLHEKFPDHLYVKRLSAIHMGRQGKFHKAVKIQKALLGQYPECISIQKEILDNLHQSRNTTLIIKILKDIVEKGKLPGIRKSKQWTYPPSTYVARYADYIGNSSEGFTKAEEMLLKTLKNDLTSAEAFHILGDIYLRQGKKSHSVVPLKCASLLDEHNEHYAKEVCDSLRKIGKEQAGLDFLKNRVEKMGSGLSGGNSWITLIEKYEEYGFPDLAITTMKKACEICKNDARLSSYAVDFWVRMGEWKEAEAILNSVNRSGQRELYLQAAVNFYRQSGEWKKSLGLCREWISESPADILARRNYLFLYAREHGRDASLKLSGEWLKKHETDEEFEVLHYDELKNMFKDSECEQLLKERVARNPQDSWALRELGFSTLNRAERCSGKERSVVIKKAEAILKICKKLTPDHPVTIVFDARISELKEENEQAIQDYFKALEQDSGYAYCYDRIWGCCITFSEAQQHEILQKLEKTLFKIVGFLHLARDLIFKIAGRFGQQVADDTINRWLERRPDDPEIIEAKADLLLYYGQGVEDAKLAARILEKELKRFPNHFNLRFSYAHACQILGAENKEAAMLKEILRRHPLNSSIREKYANFLAKQGRMDQAFIVFKQGLKCDPLDEANWVNYSKVLYETNRIEQAVPVLERALEIMPESITIRRILSEYLHGAGFDQKAVKTAKEGIDQYPDGAYLWSLYGEALWRSHDNTDIKEIETVFKKALSLNKALFEAADSLAIILSDQSRHDEARQIINDQILTMEDSAQAFGRLAWLTRQKGKNKKALQEMADVIKKWPRYFWAWQQIISWLKFDKEWKLAKELLSNVHAVVIEDPDFQADRLKLLGEAGVPNTELDSQWGKLLSNFPVNERIHCLRMDTLFQDEKWEYALQTALAIEQHHPYSPYILARKVKGLVMTDRKDQALSLAVKVWQAPGEGDVWPDVYVWEALADKVPLKDILLQIYSLVEKKSRVRYRPFLYLVENMKALSGLKMNGKKPDLLYLLNIVDQIKWNHGQYTAAVLDELIDTKRHKHVLDYYNKNNQKCMEVTSIWQSVGRIHTDKKNNHRELVKKLLSNWRNHKGCEMWALANYIICLRKDPVAFGEEKDNVEEMFITSLQALENLPHDHTVKFFVCILGETMLRKQLYDKFMEHIFRYKNLLEDDDPGLWMGNNYAWSAEFFLLFRDLMLEQDDNRVWPYYKKLKKLSKSADSWLKKELDAKVNDRLSTWEKIKGRFV